MKPRAPVTLAGIIGRNLRVIRKHAALTQGELAKRSGVARNTIGNAEQGLTLLGPDHAWELGRALGCSALAFYAGIDVWNGKAARRTAAQAKVARARLLEERAADELRKARARRQELEIDD